MHGQVKYFATSMGIHLGLMALLLTASANAVVRSRPITLDFTLNSCPVPELPPELPKKSEKPQQQMPLSPPQQAAQQHLPVEPAPAPPVQHAAPTPASPAPTRVVADTPRYSAPPIPHAAPAPVAQAVPPHRTAPAGDDRLTPEKAQQKYLKEHFAYIRDLIIKKLSYPSVARRMGWSGRVVLAFVVKEDGTVSSLKVRESSGYNALDNSAVDTVRNVAPFPKPPIAAEIIMPVQFLLD